MPQFQEAYREIKPKREKVFQEKVCMMKLLIPESEYEEMKAFAYARGMSLTFFVRQLCTMFIQQKRQQEERELRKQQIEGKVR